jgi:hypothetical protein
MRPKRLRCAVARGERTAVTVTATVTVTVELPGWTCRLSGCAGLAGCCDAPGLTCGPSGRAGPVRLCEACAAAMGVARALTRGSAAAMRIWMKCIVILVVWVCMWEAADGWA